MNKRWIGMAVGLALVGMMMAGSPIAFSQGEQAQPVVYTYVSQFQVPRANWAQYSESAEKNFVPVVEKMVADGTILSYSTFETLVHTPEGYTHGAAWSSNSLAGLTKVLDELRKSGPQPAQLTATKHEDYLMQSSTYARGSGGGAPAYLRVVCANSKPDKPEAYTAALKKYLWPTFEDQLKNGVASSVALETQYVNTSAPSLHCLVITYPSAESMDKWSTAVRATLGKMSAADREAFLGTTVADSRRDFMARITHSGRKP